MSFFSGVSLPKRDVLVTIAATATVVLAAMTVLATRTWNVIPQAAPLSSGTSSSGSTTDTSADRPQPELTPDSPKELLDVRAGAALYNSQLDVRLSDV